ncbi:protein transport protein bet1 [Curvularia kusanoi]|uniref:Protein transport protein bet1 n=1 Tax=Curvularia kusanoi TaxID=90978 RepID=A0A9P4TEP8_CURKU|nr:protein transport protein bet1 [Curvularia kusanoi]
MSSRFGRDTARDDLFSSYNRSASPSKSKNKARASPYNSSIGGGYGLPPSDTGSSQPGFSAYPGAGSNNGGLYGGATTPGGRGGYGSATLDELESQNEEQTGVLIGKVKMLKDLTHLIGDEIRDSTSLAEKMNDQFENSRNQIRGTMNRILPNCQHSNFFTVLIFLGISWILCSLVASQQVLRAEAASKAARGPSGDAPEVSPAALPSVSPVSTVSTTPAPISPGPNLRTPQSLRVSQDGSPSHLRGHPPFGQGKSNDTQPFRKSVPGVQAPIAKPYTSRNSSHLQKVATLKYRTIQQELPDADGNATVKSRANLRKAAQGRQNGAENVRMDTKSKSEVDEDHLSALMKGLANSNSDSSTSNMTSSTSVEAVAPPPRLLDADANKFRSLKQVLVIGLPGSGVDGVAEALKLLGYKVYDFKAASDRYERDFPLWLEAARHRDEARPYNKSDLDKVFGDHDAIVGAPASFFGQDLVKLYLGVKVLLVTREFDALTVNSFLSKIYSPFWQKFDPGFFGAIHQFLDRPVHVDNCSETQQVIRETVKEKNLLEIQDLTAWNPLCEFLGKPVPDVAVPDLNDDTTAAVLAARPWTAICERVKKTAHHTMVVTTNILTMLTITAAAILAVIVGIYLSVSSVLTARRVWEWSRSRGVTPMLTAGLTLCGLLCGFLVGYVFALAPKPSTIESEPARHEPRKNKSGRKKIYEGRNTTTRPKRPVPVLAEWSAVQDSIRRDDARIREERAATNEDWTAQDVTFHVTHRQTEAGQALSRGSRNVVSIMEDVE